MRKGILLVSAVFPPEQVTSAYLNYDLAKALSADYKVTVLRPRPTRPLGVSFPDKEWSDPSFETIMLDSYTCPESDLKGRLKEAVDFSRKAVDYLDAHHREISFVYNDAWQLFGYYIIAKACVKYGIPYMVPIQDIYPESLFTRKKYAGFFKSMINALFLPIDRYYQNEAYLVRTISDEMADYLSRTRRIPRDKYLVINNWQNDDVFFQGYSGRKVDEKIVFAYVGSINEHANVDLMIKAFAESAIPNSEFRIYGGGTMKEECISLAKEKGLTNVFFDLVSRDQVAWVQSQADVLVLALPAGNGSFCLPSKLTSYMLSGKPVLASIDADSAASRIIMSAGAGIIVAPDDLKAMATGFRYYGNMETTLREKEGNSSLDYALRHLTRAVNLKMIVDEIKAI